MNAKLHILISIILLIIIAVSNKSHAEQSICNSYDTYTTCETYDDNNNYIGNTVIQNYGDTNSSVGNESY